jgi:hypothetical protein
MSDADDLARRYLHLWQDYLTALMADPRDPELLEFWITAWSALAGNPVPHDSAVVEQNRLPGSPPGAASATGASCERGDAVANLASRLARVEGRLAALERVGEAAARPRGRVRRTRN